MVFKNISNLEKGITLIEIIVVIFIIGIFSVILVSDFPKIQRQFALSRAAYKLGQDIRRAEDLGLSGVQMASGIKGYGIFLNTFLVPNQYIIYADVNGDQKYNGNFIFTDNDICSQARIPTADCVIEKVDVTKENYSLQIKKILYAGETINSGVGKYVDINFSPPDPTVKINEIPDGVNKVGIVLELKTDPQTRVVWINRAGMIEVK
jgi:prepilin-type N-terminal cleavage/methylation domain-containing protein